MSTEIIVNISSRCNLKVIVPVLVVHVRVSFGVDYPAHLLDYILLALIEFGGVDTWHGGSSDRILFLETCEGLTVEMKEFKLLLVVQFLGFG